MVLPSPYRQMPEYCHKLCSDHFLHILSDSLFTVIQWFDAI
jgi:hypothetical protein